MSDSAVDYNAMSQKKADELREKLIGARCDRHMAVNISIFAGAEWALRHKLQAECDQYRKTFGEIVTLDQKDLVDGESEPTRRNLERAEHILNHYSRSRADVICLAHRLDRDDAQLSASKG